MSPQLRRAAECLRTGGLVVYPTEAVWGLGCDPANTDALRRLLALKQRPAHKGLILVASHWAQFGDWLDLDECPAVVAASWPGPTTWILPAAAGLSPLLSGGHGTLAVRISAHPPVRALCDAFRGALVSTSANHHRRASPARLAALRRAFGQEVDCYLNGPLGGEPRPSRIRDLRSGEILRS